MDTKDVVGTYYCRSGGVVDSASEMSWAQVQAMYAGGWNIGNHTQSHSILTELTDPQIVAEINACRADLAAHGITVGVDHMSYVGGNYSDRVIAAVQSAGIISARTVANLAYPAFPFENVFTIKSVKPIEWPLTITEAKAWVDTIISQHSIGVAMFHTLVETAGVAYEWGIADFQSLIDYLVSTGVRVVTMAEAYDLYNGMKNYEF